MILQKIDKNPPQFFILKSPSGWDLDYYVRSHSLFSFFIIKSVLITTHKKNGALTNSLIAPYRFFLFWWCHIRFNSLARSRCSCWWKNGQQRQYVNWAGHSWSLGSVRLTFRNGSTGPKKLLAEDASPVERRGESRYRTLQRPAYPR